LLAKVYINLIDQKEPTLNFQNIDQRNVDLSENKTLYYKKIIKPIDKEIQSHKKYLNESLKKNYF